MATLGKARDFFFGQRSNEVQLPKEYQQSKDQQNKLFSQIYKNYMRGGPTEGEQAAQMATEMNLDRALAGQEAMANTGRGFGAVAARYQAMNNTGQLQQQIAGQGIQTAAEIRAQERANQQNYLSQVANQRMQQALAEEEWRKQNAKKGIFGTLLGTAGGIAGAYFGKSPEAAAAGAQLGYGIGEATSSVAR